MSGGSVVGGVAATLAVMAASGRGLVVGISFGALACVGADAREA